jgi:alkylated DNA repair protein (DNA oxidative demethylase)
MATAPSPAPAPLAVAPGVFLWRAWLAPKAQQALLSALDARLKAAPLYRPTMPGSGKPFSVEQSNLGPLGWVSDKTGYRYQPLHPVTARPWPDIPPALTALWGALAPHFRPNPPPPSCCLVNFYRAGARMGLHQDRDEADATQPVIAISLGNTAVFRIGGTARKGPTRSVALASGDVIAFGGAARMAFHGIDRIRPGTSTLVPGGGRFSLTLRHVAAGG